MIDGTKVRNLRGPRSQRSVAIAAGLTEATLSRIERGRLRNPSLSTVEALARALGHGAADLLADDTDEAAQ